jgi:hypothetical protein
MASQLETKPRVSMDDLFRDVKISRGRQMAIAGQEDR